MTDTAELIARAIEEAEYHERMNVAPLSTRTTLRDLADALSSLVRERDEARMYSTGTWASQREADYYIIAAGAAETRATAAEADAARMREALEQAERFLAYFSGETRNEFIGSGTPATCLATIRAALVGADHSLAPAHPKPVAWRARRYGSSEWEVFGYDPRALKQFSFFEPLYARNALGGKDE